MISSNVSSADGNNAGLLVELDAILAVVIGGTSLAGGRFSLGGTVLGALIIQTLTTTVYAMASTPQTSLLFKAVVVIVVCLIQAPAFRARFRRRRQRPGDSGGAGQAQQKERGAGMTTTPLAAPSGPCLVRGCHRAARAGAGHRWPCCWSCTASASRSTRRSPTSRSSSTSSSTTASCSSSRSA